MTETLKGFPSRMEETLRVKSKEVKFGAFLACRLCFLLALVCFRLKAADTSTPLPSVILLLTDDMGYGEVACNGGKLVPTPNIDRMAREGTRLQTLAWKKSLS
jgi:hypothetical protein